MATAATNDANARARLTVDASGGQNIISWSASVTDNNPSFSGFGANGASWTVTAGPYTLASASNQSYDFGTGNVAGPYFPRSQSGTVTGVPAGTYTVSGTFTTTGLVGTATITPFSVTVTAPPPPTPAPVIADGSIVSSATVGVVYNDEITASNSPTYSVVAAPNNLPPGLTLNTSTGAITGTPTTPGVYSFVIRASNAGGSADTSTLTITVTSGARVWNGTAFVSSLTNVWNGTAFVSGIIKVWDGTVWKNTN
jgi:hypothetical protein